MLAEGTVKWFVPVLFRRLRGQLVTIPSLELVSLKDET